MRVPESQAKRDQTKRLVGLEFENPITDRDGNPIRADVIQRCMDDMQNLGWRGERDTYSGNMLDVNKEIGGGNVNVGTDCAWSSLELSLSPHASLQAAESQYHAVRDEIIRVLKAQPVRWLGIGILPGNSNIDNTYKTTRPFYRVVNSFLRFHNLNLLINAHQTGVSVNLEEALLAVNELTKICGLIIALCANSSLHQFRPLPWKEWRALSWKYFGLTNYPGTEKLFGMPDRTFHSLADYFGYFWKSSPVMFLTPLREKAFTILEEKMDWLTFLRGAPLRGQNLNGTSFEEIRAEPSDLNLAFMVQWPSVKLHLVVDPSQINLPDFISAFDKDDLEGYLAPHIRNLYIEYRIGSAAPVGEEMALPALTLGLVNNLEELRPFTARFSWDQWIAFMEQAAILGMEAALEKNSAQNLLTDLVEIAERGLLKRQLGEEAYLTPLRERITLKETPADRYNALVQTQGPQALLDAISYF